MITLKEVIKRFLPNYFTWHKELIKDMENLIMFWVLKKLPKKKEITEELLEKDKEALAYFSDGWNNAIIEMEENIKEE